MKLIAFFTLICSFLISQTEWIYFSKMDFETGTISIWKINPIGSDSSMIIEDGLISDVSINQDQILLMRNLDGPSATIVNYDLIEGTELNIGEGWFPRFAQNDQKVLFTTYDDDQINTQIWIFDNSTSEVALLADSVHRETTFDLSPQGNKIVYYEITNEWNDNIVILDLSTMEKVTLSSNGNAYHDFSSGIAWSPSDVIFYEGSEYDTVQNHIYKISIDGTGEQIIGENLVNGRKPFSQKNANSDVKIGFIESPTSDSVNIWIYSTTNDILELVYADNVWLGWNRMWSPDGDKIVFDKFAGENAFISIIEIGTSEEEIIAEGIYPIWSYTESVSVLNQINTVPSTIHLEQNYPNPFNPVTTISYQLPKSSFVNISIYNIAGQLVETLVNEYKNIGYHSIIWNANGSGSGLYFYQIEAGEYSETKKCLILK